MNQKGDKVQISSKRYGMEGEAVLVEKINESKKRERWVVKFIGENRLFKRTIPK